MQLKGKARQLKNRIWAKPDNGKTQDNGKNDNQSGIFGYELSQNALRLFSVLAGRNAIFKKVGFLRLT